MMVVVSTLALGARAGTIAWTIDPEIAATDMYGYMVEGVMGATIDYSRPYYVHILLCPDWSLETWDVGVAIPFDGNAAQVIDGRMLEFGADQPTFYTPPNPLIEAGETYQVSVHFAIPILPNDSGAEYALVYFHDPFTVMATDEFNTLPPADLTGTFFWDFWGGFGDFIPFTPIPEPATGLLALAGIALLIRRKRK